MRTFPLALLLLAACSQKPQATIILATTTSVQDSGLLDELLPAFTKKTGIAVKPIAVGSGEAIEMARRGAADAVLAHSPDAELKLVEEGVALDRRTIMTNTFLIVGPADDPAKVKGAPSAREAFVRIGSSGRFVSRGDKSGTHAREMKLWTEQPGGPRYIQSGAGMGETLLIADQKGAYTLADLATFLAFEKRVKLVVLFEGGDDLVNRYSVMRVKTGAPEAAKFVEWMTTDALPLVAEFGKAKYGRALFVPEGK